MPNLKEIPISRVAPSGRAAIAGPSRYAGWDMQRAARGEEQARATVGRGIQQLSAGVGAMGDKLHQQLVGDQTLTAGAEYETGLQKFFVDVDNTRHVKDGIPQWDKILEQGDARHKEIVGGISQNLVPDAKKAFLNYAQGRKVDFDKTLYNKIQGIRGNYIGKVFPLSMMRFARSNDTEASERFLNQLKKNYFPKSQWQALDKAFDKSTILGAIGKGLSPENIEQRIKEAESLTQDEKNSLRRHARTEANYATGRNKIALELQQEKDRDAISELIKSGKSAETTIQSSSLNETEQWVWSGRNEAASERLAKGEEIITDNEMQSSLYTSIFQVFSGAKTHKEALDEAKEARLPGLDEKGKPIPPTLSQEDYEAFEIAINANYKESYKYQMGKVNETARGLLLQPNTFGIIENAPIRYKIYGKFQKAWLKWIEEETIKDRIKISDIGPEGARIASMFHLTDEEIERQEQVLLEGLRVKEEARKAGGKAGGKAAVEAIKKIAAQADLAKSLKPTARKGPRNNPQFIITDGQPEMEHNAEGKEIGLKLEGGAVLKIGYQYRIGNNVWEYLGNGRAKRIK